MIYIEYFRRHLHIDPEDFHQVITSGFDRWGTQHSEDQLVLHAARTWRLGPEPEYFVVWHSPAFGFERFDSWERVFRSGAADASQREYRRVGRIEFAGCYEALLPPVPARNGTYYVEFFRATGELPALCQFYQQRSQQHQQLRLNLLVHRIGRLGPDPGGLALWTIPSLAALGNIAGELDGVREPVQLEAAGTYQDIGKQIL